MQESSTKGQNAPNVKPELSNADWSEQPWGAPSHRVRKCNDCSKHNLFKGVLTTKIKMAGNER